MYGIKLLVFIFSCSVYLCSISCAQRSTNLDDLLNSCIQSVNHKSSPGPEAELYSQCKPWEKRSCCTHNTTRDVHTANLYNFDFDHCRKLSPECKRHFTQDFCFFECSPNVGPWVEEVDMKTRKERFRGVPLCRSDCWTWFDACRYDLTCAINWLSDFKWSEGKNRCHQNSFCYTFEELFNTAEDFCEMVWDDSWKVVADDQSCMRLWFNPAQGNPNDLVARLRAEQLIPSNSSSAHIVPPQLTAVLLLIVFNYLITSFVF